MAWKAAIAQRNRAGQAVTDRLNGGVLRVYSGTRPATPDTALSGNVLLAELTFGNPAFGSFSNGQATANAITQDSSADATGTATWARLYESGGTVVVGDADCGTSGSDINWNSVSFVAGGIVQITSMTYLQN